MKSIKLDIHTFDGRLEPKYFHDWLQNMDRYFTWYSLSEARKVKFAAMKLME